MKTTETRPSIVVGAQPIARECITDRVRQVIFDRILNGDYPPGFRLVEMQLARELNVSQAPVREALRELEAAHLVETEPWRGTRVRQITERERTESYQVRAVLEELAAQLAAGRIGDRIDSLRAAADAASHAAKHGDADGYIHHNLAFHRIIVDAADNQVLLRLWNSIGLALGAHVRMAGGDIAMAQAANEHNHIVEALARGDGRTAGRLLRAHSEVFAHSVEEDGAQPESVQKLKTKRAKTIPMKSNG